MSKLFKALIYLIAFFLAFFAFKGIKATLSEDASINASRIEAEQVLNKVNSSVPTKDGQTINEAKIETAKQEAINYMASASSDNTKLEKAIDVFRGFYLINVVARPRYCLKNKVSIDKFTNKFKTQYAREFAVMKNYENTQKPVQAKTAQLLEELLDKQIATEMESTAEQFKISVPAYCQNINDYADEHVSRLDLKSRAPEIYETLNK